MAAPSHDSLPNSIPRLDLGGENWAIFRFRFEDAVRAKRLWGHFDGTSTRPVSPQAPAAAAPAAAAPALGPQDWPEGQAPAGGNAAAPQAPDPAVVAAQAAIATEQYQFDDREAVAHYLLSQRLPDSTLIRVRHHTTVADRWAAVVGEFTDKSVYAQTSMKNEFLESKAPKGANIKLFLGELATKREMLAQCGVDISDDNFRSTIVSSLPYALAKYASSLLTSSNLMTRNLAFLAGRNIAPGQAAAYNSIDPNLLIQIIGSEWEREDKDKQRQQATTANSKSSNEKSKPKDKDVALSATEGKPKETRKCYNCNKVGHLSKFCRSPRKEKKDAPAAAPAAKTTTESANAVDSDSDSDWAMAATEADDWEDKPAALKSGLTADPHDEAPSCAPGFEDWLEDVHDPSTLGTYVPDEHDLEFEIIDGVEVAALVTHPTAETPDCMRRTILDSGCTRHLSPYKKDFVTFKTIAPKAMRAANNNSFHATGEGDLVVKIPNGNDTTHLRLVEALYSPEVGFTLISIGSLDKEGYSATFSGERCIVRDANGEQVAEVPRSDRGLYRFSSSNHEDEHVNVADEVVSLEDLHARLGHIAPSTAAKLVKNGFVTGVKLDTNAPVPTFCESCVYGRATRKPVASSREGEKSAAYGDKFFSDVWGPAPTRSINGKHYYITFTDDATRMTYLYLLRTKGESLDAYKKLETMVETQHQTKIKVLHSDRGGEYTGHDFVNHLESKGTRQELTVHDTPEHNGVAERVNRIVGERMRAMLHASGLPKFLWAEAAKHGIWCKNRTGTKALGGKSPYEAFLDEKPNLNGVPQWGCRVWVHDASQSKLSPRAREGRWLGYDPTSNGSRIYWPETKSLTVERSIYFDESRRFEGERSVGVENKTTATDAPADTQPTPTNFTNFTSSPQQPPITLESIPPRSQRKRQPSAYLQRIQAGESVDGVPRGMQTNAGESNVVEDDYYEEYAFEAAMHEADGREPRSYAEATRVPEKLLWIKAMEEEEGSLVKAGTWEEVHAPKNVNIVGSKWVYKAKRDAAGNVVRYKARLVAQGFSQVEGVDYTDTYAPVTKLPTIRTVLAMAARLDLELDQIDVKSAYLNGELDESEVIYMRPPPGLTRKDGKVFKLKRPIYGLKQSGRKWFEKVTWILVDQMGLTRCDVDQGAFFKRDGDKILIAIVHVDDFTIAASTREQIEWFKQRMEDHVEITDLGTLHWLLGIEVRRNRDERTISLSQTAYIDTILRRFNFDELKPVSVPMDPNTHLHTPGELTTDELALVRDFPMQECIGSLMYCSIGTRVDISFAVSLLSRFTKNFDSTHIHAVKRVYRYLNGTKHLWLTYGDTKGDELKGYGDADGNMQEDRRAISGNAFIIDGGAVSWFSKRQEVVSLSTTESEYIAATHAAKEAIWLRQLIAQLFEPIAGPTVIFSDNQSAIALAKDHQFHSRTKHIDVRYHFIRWVCANGTIKLVYCPTADMVADTLTKALPSLKVKHFASQLGLRTI